jgi:3-hydroxyisobutyrate dehydrogenase
MATVGFIGLGNMGGPMAANLAKAGHTVRGFDLNPAAVDALVAAGGHRAGSATEAAQGADVVITMLPAGQHVRDVWMHQGGLIEVLKAGGNDPILIDSSTIDVESARAVAAEAAAAGLPMVDAPVSGGVVGATEATLTFMCGGDPAAFAKAEPFLKAMGRNIVLAGGPGAGQAAKICNNMMVGICMIAASEGFLLADRLGLDRQKFWDIASTSSGQSWALSKACPAPGPVASAASNRDYAPGFMTALMLKDMLLSQAAAEATGTATPLGSYAASIYQALADAGEARKDFSVVFRWLGEQERNKLLS